jgi:hypothetical protein
MSSWLPRSCWHLEQRCYNRGSETEIAERGRSCHNLVREDQRFYSAVGASGIFSLAIFERRESATPPGALTARRIQLEIAPPSFSNHSLPRLVGHRRTQKNE